MCTYIVYTNRDSDTPLVVATTRDENPVRKTAPAFKWQDPALFIKPLIEPRKINLHFIEEKGVEAYLEAEIIAPRDQELGGTFLAQNKYGVVAAVNNREHTPFIERKIDTSTGVGINMAIMPRGGLPLDALAFSSAKEAAFRLWPEIQEVQRNNPRKYSGFNLVIADAKNAYVITNAKAGDITLSKNRLDYENIEQFSLALWEMPQGKVSMLAGFDLNDYSRSERTANHLHLLNSYQKPVAGDFSSWHAWLDQMAYRHHDYSHNPFDLSICQPDPHKLASLKAGEPDWVTVATHLMVTQKTESGIITDWHAIDGQLLHGKLGIPNLA